MRRPLLVAATLLGLTSAAVALGETGALNEIIRSYLNERGTDVQLAPHSQLARRYAIDLTGVVPSIADLEATADMDPGDMFDYFAGKAAMPHTAGAPAYVWVNTLKDADHFLFSNSTQFSQPVHIDEFHTQLSRVYTEGWSYQEFARWAMTSQMFLNRFPSASDRANASFFLFLGRDSFASEIPCGNMWEGYGLRNPDIPESDAETNPDYHVYDYDPTRCTSGEVLCEGELWGHVGSTPQEVIELMVTSDIFAEATVERYWRRLIGLPLPGTEFPELRLVLAQGLIANDFNINWLIREIATSAAYTQEMMYR